DVFFDDESAEVVVSSLRIAEEQDSGGLREAMFTNANWFAFQDDRPADQPVSTSLVSSSQRGDDSHVNNTVMSANSGGSSSSDDEVVVGEDDDLVDTDTSQSASAPGFDADFGNGTTPNGVDLEMKGKTSLNLLDDLSLELEKVDITDNLSFIQCEERTVEIFGVKAPEWVGWRETADFEGTSGRNPFGGTNPFDSDIEHLSNTCDDSKSAEANQVSGVEIDGVSSKEISVEGSVSGPQGEVQADELKSKTMSLFEDNVEFVGVEIEGTQKAMEHALKEGIVGEAAPIKVEVVRRLPE
ncbi:hypothetical protein KI387_025003, partial [Taxus chinensis]